MGSTCQNCPKNTFKNSVGNGACTACSYGKTTAGTGNDDISDCKCAANYYQSQCQRYCSNWGSSQYTTACQSGNAVCCNSHGTCNTNGDCVCSAGYYSGTNCDFCGTAYCGADCDMVCSTCALETLTTTSVKIDGTDILYFKTALAHIEHVAHGNPSQWVFNGQSFSSTTLKYISGVYLPVARNRIGIKNVRIHGSWATKVNDQYYKLSRRGCKSCGLFGLGNCCETKDSTVQVTQQPSSTNDYTLGIRMDDPAYGAVVFEYTITACDINPWD